MENEIKFPDYCCFGPRQSGQLIETADGITAVYEMSGIKVHELCYDTGRRVWTLSEYAPGGRRTRLTCNTVLDRTICNHTIYLDDEKNELLGILRQQLLQFGPVWLAPLPSFTRREKSITYSPAGKILIVRLLLSSGCDCSQHLNTLNGMYEYHDPVTRLNLRTHRFYETSLAIQRDDKTSYWHLAFIGEFIVPLALVFDTVKLFHDRGLIGLNGLDRVMIFDVPQEAESRILEFEVGTIPYVASYSVILKGLAVSNEGFDIQHRVMEQKYQVESL